MRVTKEQYASLMAKRKSKYGAVKTEVDGQKFDSKREANRYLALKARESAKEIRDLRTQVKFPIVIKGIKVCDYVCDFTYYLSHGDLVVEDCKGFKTAMYRLKRRLVEASYGIRILET